MSESQLTKAALDSIAEANARAEAANVRAEAAEARAVKAEAENRELRALMAKLKTSLAEQSNDPMTDGVSEGQRK